MRQKTEIAVKRLMRLAFCEIMNSNLKIGGIMEALILALILVSIAEIGDKTQIMAMAYSKKLTVRSVLSGVFLGALMSHGLAVIVGTFIRPFFPTEGITFITGLLFILFGLLSLGVAERYSKDRESTESANVFSIGWSFFKGEFGDKTQLVTLTLAIQFHEPLWVFTGAVAGMLLITVLGIATGTKFGSKFPEYRLRVLAWGMFFLVGSYQIFTSAYVYDMGMIFMILLMGIVTALTLFRWVIFRRQTKEISMSVLKQEAESLMHFRGQIVTDLCTGCENCMGANCAVNCMLTLLEDEAVPQSIKTEALPNFQNVPFDASKAKGVLDHLKTYYEQHPEAQIENGSLKRIEKILNQVINGDTVHEKINLKEN